MAAVNQNMFDASITTDHRPRGASLMVLPLNLLGLIISHLDNTGDLARLCRTCRVLNYMSLPQLYRHITLTSYEKIRYHGDEPEGMGSASPFSMGLNAVITRPYSSLVRSLTLRGDWREHELEEHARVGRVPDSAMMLNIAVRAAVDRMTDLESFSWELNTKMLETVYLGLAQLPKLTSLTVRFPSSRHPRPTIAIPPMPHLRSLKITDIDPLCYPDDISTLLWKSKKLRELKMHWSPRMRNAQEPSVMLHDYFRKCIAARQPIAVNKIALQNLYALHSEEFNLAFDPRLIEELTVLNDVALDNANMNTFVDSTWPTNPPEHAFHIKAARQDHTSKRHADFLGSFTGLEKLYFVSATHDPNDDINSPRQSAVSTLTPPSLDHTNSTLSGPMANNSPAPPSSTSPNFQTSIRDSYLNTITVNHAATLRHLLLPSRWPLSASAIARLVHASPQLEQLAFATELSSMDTLGLLLPFLRKLVALRLLVPTGCAIPANGAPQSKKQQALGACASVMGFYSAHTLADLVELDDDVLVEKFGEALADPQVFSQLTVIGLGRKAWQLGEYYTVPADSREGNLESQPPTPTVGAEANGHQDNSPVSLVNERSASQSEGSPLTPAPNPNTALAKPSTRIISQPPSLLGKRQRESDPSPPAPQDDFDDATQFQGNSYPFPRLVKDGRIWRRRVRRVGWEVLQHWEIWGLDTREI